MAIATGSAPPTWRWPIWLKHYSDVHVVDIAAALNAAGAERLLDDGQVGFTHFGSPGWLLQRPESEKAAVHGIFPDISPLAQCCRRRSLCARGGYRAVPMSMRW